MKNIIMPLIVSLIVFGSILIICSYSENRKYVGNKKSIEDKIIAYGDSIIKIRGQLALMRAENILHHDSRDVLKLEAAQYEQRMSLNRKMWQYEWMIDSLKIRLKQ